MRRITWTAVALAVFTLVGCNVSFAHDGHDHPGGGGRRPGGFERERGHDHDHGGRDSGFGFGFDSRGFGFGFERGFRFERGYDYDGCPSSPWNFTPRSHRTYYPYHTPRSWRW
jgi:hypothetical protein